MPASVPWSKGGGSPTLAQMVQVITAQKRAHEQNISHNRAVVRAVAPCGDSRT